MELAAAGLVLPGPPLSGRSASGRATLAAEHHYLVTEYTISASLYAWMRLSRTSQPKTRVVIMYRRRTDRNRDLAPTRPFGQTAAHSLASSSGAVRDGADPVACARFIAELGVAGQQTAGVVGANIGAGFVVISGGAVSAAPTGICPGSVGMPVVPGA